MRFFLNQCHELESEKPNTRLSSHPPADPVKHALYMQEGAV